MKNEGITQGPLFAVQDSVGAWCVTVGNSRFDQQVAYVGTDNPHVKTGSAKGNAQLFAAAPDMRDALHLARGIMSGYLHATTFRQRDNAVQDMENAIYAMANALAKAEGRA